MNRRLLAGGLALATSIGCGSRKAVPAARTGAPRPVEAEDSSSRPIRPSGRRAPVIWLGLDGLDWDWMDRLSAAGRVPNWSKLVAEGASDKLASFMPILSPVVWTTMATGVGPDVHRVLDFQEIEAKTGRKVPVSGLSRAVPALWNLASAAHVRVGVVGWWATHPAEVVNGFLISDRASPISFPTAPLSGVAYPPALDESVRRVVTRDGVVALADLRPYLGLSDPEIAQGLSSPDGMKNPVFALARILASTRVNQRLARELYDRELPDFMTVYFEGTDEIGHVFASYAPPRLACVSDDDARRYGKAAETYFATIDMILGQWMRRAREDGATLIVTSDHGFKWGAERPCERSSSEWSTAAFWHRPDGVFAAWGTRVSPGRDREHPSVFDIAPTVLALLGLPADVRMTGKSIADAFGGLPRPAPQRIFERIAVARVASEAVSTEEAAENAKKLFALGYLSGRDAAATNGPVPANGELPGLTEGAYNNLGLYERETRRDSKAAEKDFQRALALRPGYHSPLFNLAILYRNQGRDALARDFLFRALAAGHADPAGTILGWASEYRSARKPASETELLRRASTVFPGDEPIARAFGDALFRRHDCAGAEQALARFGEAAREPETLNGLGLYETCLGHRDHAVELFHRSLAMKSDQPGVRQALAVLAR